MEASESDTPNPEALHWAQQADDHHPKQEGTWCGTLNDRVKLEWCQQNFKQIVLLDPATNVAPFHTTPSYLKFEAYCSIIETHHNAVAPPLITFELYPIFDNEASENAGSDGIDEPHENDEASLTAHYGRYLPVVRQLPVVTDFDLQGYHDGATAPATVDDKEDHAPDLQSKLLCWHHKFRHIYFSKLRRIAAHGDIPKRLADCKIPMCTACLFGKATKRRWRTRAAPKRIKMVQITKLGDVGIYIHSIHD